MLRPVHATRDRVHAVLPPRRRSAHGARRCHAVAAVAHASRRYPGADRTLNVTWLLATLARDAPDLPGTRYRPEHLEENWASRTIHLAADEVESIQRGRSAPSDTRSLFAVPRVDHGVLASAFTSGQVRHEAAASSAPLPSSTAPVRALPPDGMLSVLGGTFVMGSTDVGGQDDEHPAHRVDVADVLSRSNRSDESRRTASA